ncbi:MAG: hypothetical protein WD696_20290 [Bryobacteraceae bacterium]
MEPLNDNELRDLLRQWDAPAAPAHLERQIFGEPRKQRWRWLLTGSIRVPVPVFALLLLVLSALMYVLPRSRRAPPAFAHEVSLSDFQPVAELKPRIIRRAYETN